MSVLSACVHHALANGGPILWAKICFDSISFLILIWSSSIPIFVSNGTGSNWTCAVCAVMQYRTPFDIALSTANVFLKLIWATKIHTHNIHVIQLQTSQDDQILVPLVFRFLEQSIEPTSSAFRARWVHYLSGRPIRSTAVAAEELITLAAQVTVLSILLKDVYFRQQRCFGGVFSSWAACGLSSILDCLQRGRFFQHLECIINLLSSKIPGNKRNSWCLVR